jgi:hypothetical protein
MLRETQRQETFGPDRFAGKPYCAIAISYLEGLGKAGS